jgi:hypothetical protein
MTPETVLNAQWHAATSAELTEVERKRPFMLLRPRMFPDGNQWCALYGDDLMSGVCGFGATPELAAQAFDHAWHNEKVPEVLKEEVYDCPIHGPIGTNDVCPRC